MERMELISALFLYELSKKMVELESKKIIENKAKINTNQKKWILSFQRIGQKWQINQEDHLNLNKLKLFNKQRQKLFEDRLHTQKN